MSSRSTLQKKDSDAAGQKVSHKGSDIFKTEDIIRKGSNVERYEELLNENKLLFTADLIKEKLVRRIYLGYVS